MRTVKPSGNEHVAKQLALLYSSEEDSDCVVVFCVKVSGPQETLTSVTVEPSNKRQRVCNGFVSAPGRGDSIIVGDPLPGHQLVLRFASERFNAQLKRWDTRRPRDASGNTEQSGPAPPTFDGRPILRVALTHEGEEPSARAAIRYAYTGDVQASTIREALEVRLQAVNLRIEGCAAACIQIVKAKLEEAYNSNTATITTNRGVSATEGEVTTNGGGGNTTASSQSPHCHTPKHPPAVVLELFSCQALWPDVAKEPEFNALLAAAKPQLVLHFGDVLRTLNTRHLRQQLLKLPATAVEAVLESDDFGTDNESSVLLLLATWMEANRATTNATTRERLCRQIRLVQLSRPYLACILPVLALDHEITASVSTVSMKAAPTAGAAPATATALAAAAGRTAATAPAAAVAQVAETAPPVAAAPVTAPAPAEAAAPAAGVAQVAAAALAEAVAPLLPVALVVPPLPPSTTAAGSTAAATISNNGANSTLGVTLTTTTSTAVFSPGAGSSTATAASAVSSRPASGASASAAWFPIRGVEAAFICSLATAQPPLREALLAAGRKLYDLNSPWYLQRRRRQCLPAMGLVYNWRISEVQLAQVLTSLQPGGLCCTAASFCGDVCPSCVTAAGFEWWPSIEYRQGALDANLGLYSAFPEVYSLPGSRFAVESDGAKLPALAVVAGVDADLSVHHWPHGALVDDGVYFNTAKDMWPVGGGRGANVVMLAQEPTAAVPRSAAAAAAAGSSGSVGNRNDGRMSVAEQKLGAWRAYLRNGEMAGTLTLLPPSPPNVVIT